MDSYEEEFTPYAWEELAQKWERAEMTMEQLAGQLLVWSRRLHEMVERTEREQGNMGDTLADLNARLVGIEEQLTEPAQEPAQG